jgi:hypothetical protein
MFFLQHQPDHSEVGETSRYAEKSRTIWTVGRLAGDGQAFCLGIAAPTGSELAALMAERCLTSSARLLRRSVHEALEAGNTLAGRQRVARMGGMA